VIPPVFCGAVVHVSCGAYDKWEERFALVTSHASSVAEDLAARRSVSTHRRRCRPASNFYFGSLSARIKIIIQEQTASSVLPRFARSCVIRASGVSAKPGGMDFDNELPSARRTRKKLPNGRCAMVKKNRGIVSLTILSCITFIGDKSPATYRSIEPEAKRRNSRAAADHLSNSGDLRR
jgi:hypothetical protein